MNQIRFSIYLALTTIFLTTPQSIYAHTAKLSLGTKLENRELKNKGEHFTANDEHIWAQIELKPAKKGTLQFIWTRDGHPYTKFSTSVKESPRYRTQSYVTAHPGSWHIMVMSDTNVILAEKDFIIEGKGSTAKSSPTSEQAKKQLKSNGKKATSVQAKEKPVSGIKEALKAISPTDSRATNKAEHKENAEKVDAKLTTTKA